MEPSSKFQSQSLSDESLSLIAIFEDCLGCKWTLQILMQIAAGFQRPGELLRKNQGLSTKVLNECLARLIDYKILTKQSYAEIPPRVEYHLTAFGQDFLEILSRLKSML